MSKNYIIEKTHNQLITIGRVGMTYRNRQPKEALMDAAQRAYLSLKAEYGTNIIITLSLLLEKMGCAESTFNDNFCGGINGFLAQSERVVIDRFTEAIKSVEGDLIVKLTSGLRALYRVQPRSRYNLYRKTMFDMNLRTSFCCKVLSTAYWSQVTNPLSPAINAYLAENDAYWNEVPEASKAQAYTLFAEIFRWVVDIMTEEDLRRYPIMEQGRCLKDYIGLFCKLIIVQARALFDDRYHYGTELSRIAERMNQTKSVKYLSVG